MQTIFRDQEILDLYPKLPSTFSFFLEKTNDEILNREKRINEIKSSPFIKDVINGTRLNRNSGRFELLTESDKAKWNSLQKELKIMSSDLEKIKFFVGRI